jgi:hypothetical protein
MTSSVPNRAPAKKSLQELKERRDAAARKRTAQREARWSQHRYAVPYRTDGPKITLGLVWFAGAVAAAYFVPFLLVPLVAAVAAVAGLQVGHAWRSLVDRNITAAVAGVIAFAGVFGGLGAGITVILAALGFAAYGAYTTPVPTSPRGPSHAEAVIHVAETYIRCAVPAGVAAASLLGLLGLEFSAFLSLVLLISSYEAGDFLIGTGSANAVEGPVAGIVALTVTASALYFVLPAPFDTNSFPVFVVLAAIAAPLGQIAGSAILPRGAAWAPALRRLDSYLIAAPIWLLMLPRP